MKCPKSGAVKYAGFEILGRPGSIFRLGRKEITLFIDNEVQLLDSTTREAVFLLSSTYLDKICLFLVLPAPNPSLQY